MFKNFLLISFRNIIRHKGYAFINITGLSVGITCCIFIFLYVHFELSYDTYHSDVERIFRVGLTKKTPSGESLQASNLIPMGPTLKENYPQIEYAGRVCKPFSQPTVRYGDKIFKEENIYKADMEIFSIFRIPFLYGDPNTALDHPNTAVLTETFSKKYFGDEDPLGKTIQINTKDFMVTGLVENSP